MTDQEKSQIKKQNENQGVATEKRKTEEEKITEEKEIADENEDRNQIEEEMEIENTASESDKENQEILELKAKVEENYQRFLRVQADFDNFRRRYRLEKEDLLKYGSIRFLEQFLPVMDNFERAVDASKETNNIESMIQGLEMVYRQLNQVLEQEGVTVINEVGVPFDPSIHQAVMQVESADYPSGSVVAVLQKGYKLKDKIIRPAMVQVNS
ncbi:nucleotide exchange factor GrpE [Microaerobacter geothermalis]|uniref:nucleotide exchange factor GrpE n=1 Tax=Microaerobacter geothermalis TaxID=674972 RepID=UPI001F262E6C|nr:nucleotide exchange factor GrpE [Microaerobacter geothermalis]MCF6092865.1 nucleotide exchange factor GrpE [Microaerobacter geothermalis]